MKKEVTCCDSCERVLDGGGLRIRSENRSGEPIDLCPECLAEVLPAFSEQTGEDFLKVQISDEDFLALSGDETEDDDEDEASEITETMFAEA